MQNLKSKGKCSKMASSSDLARKLLLGAVGLEKNHLLEEHCFCIEWGKCLKMGNEGNQKNSLSHVQHSSSAAELQMQQGGVNHQATHQIQVPPPPPYNSSNSNKPFLCHVCNKCFRQEAHLKTHLKTHSEDRPYVCECGKSFRGQTSLKLHKMIHDGDKQYCCDICSKSFRQKTHLKSHSVVHSSERPFVCYICNKGFGLSSRLKTHLKQVHTKEKPYSCQICGKCFGSSDTLKKHHRIHTGEKPFPCNVCTKGFRQKAHLHRHMRSHSKEAGSYSSYDLCANTKSHKRLKHGLNMSMQSRATQMS